MLKTVANPLLIVALVSLSLDTREAVSNSFSTCSDYHRATR